MVHRDVDTNAVPEQHRHRVIGGYFRPVIPALLSRSQKGGCGVQQGLSPAFSAYSDDGIGDCGVGLAGTIYAH